jgi:hypothetical protein
MRAEPYHARHAYFRVEKSCDLWLAMSGMYVCVKKLLHRSYCTELMFYRYGELNQLN